MKRVSVLFLTAFLSSCSSPADAPKSSTETPKTTDAKTSDANGNEDTQPPAYESALPEDMRSIVSQPFTGDFDEMVKRRLIRVGVSFNRTFYFIDHGVQRGLAYEYVGLYEDQLNARLKTGNLKIHVILLPMTRDALFPALTSGKVDLVVAQLTVTPERQKVVDFTQPTRRNVDEVIVTGPGGPSVTSADDLSGQEVFVRKTSSYYASLVALNQKLVMAGRKPVAIQETSESLEDDDILEMVNAGLIPVTVVDNYLADFWKQVFTDLNVHSAVASADRRRSCRRDPQEQPEAR